MATVLLLCVGVPGVLAGPTGPQPLERWIVQVAPGTDSGPVAQVARTHFGATIGVRFSNVVNGFATQLTVTQRDQLAADPRVIAVVPDQPIHAAGDPYPTTDTEIQPGIRRVGATDNQDRADPNLDVDIAVLDTGIQADNPDLNIAGGYDCTHPTDADPTDPANWSDTNTNFGHGTHVSGIAAAIQNGRGVAGVAQGARLWAIKVLDGNGNGYWSWVICGLDRVAAMKDPNDPSVPRIEVVNMSIAAPGWDDGDCGLSNSDLLHQAICRVYDAGITMVAAAGNEHRDTSGYIPGAYDEVITVSAMADWNRAGRGRRNAAGRLHAYGDGRRVCEFQRLRRGRRPDRARRMRAVASATERPRADERHVDGDAARQRRGRAVLPRGSAPWQAAPHA